MRSADPHSKRYNLIQSIQEHEKRWLKGSASSQTACAVLIDPSPSCEREQSTHAAECERQVSRNQFRLGLRPDVGSRGFLESSSGGNHHRGSVDALDVLDLLGDTLGMIDSVLGKHGAGQHDDTLRRGHTDVDVLADAIGS